MVGWEGYSNSGWSGISLSHLGLETFEEDHHKEKMGNKHESIK